MRILFVKLGAIGDLVHTLPSLTAVLIELDTKTIREWKTAGRGIRELFARGRQIRLAEYDISIDFQGLLKSAAIGFVSKANRRWGFARESLREPASRILLTNSLSIPKGTHVIRKNLMLAATAIGTTLETTDLSFPIFTGDNNKLEAEKIAISAGGNFALLNPAGGWPTKLWAAERFGELADRIWDEHNLVSVLSTGPNEQQLKRRALSASRSGKLIHAEPSLKTFFELAKRARIYLGGDTGPTHIAIAARTPVVGIFGPTEWWRNGSLNAGDLVVERNDIGCRIDCHRRACSNWICMEISVEKVAEVVTQRLAATAKL
ncbi:MAG: glycosyltransferase family 9 protein [Acidobacteria bacterium]|nr:glycosyltransferase family 9 protein [Acidobacteriota bacterium]